MSYEGPSIGERPSVGYFCMEFGLDERLPIYSGGLGVLAGDFMRSAHALGLPVVGVGILWEEGYTTQAIGPAGETIDLPTPRTLGAAHLVKEAPIVTVGIGGRDVPLWIWRVEGLNAAPLYLLEPIVEHDRWINRRLYGGGKDDRVAQEIVLGVGGVRALQALGIDVDVYHFNEGHALFAGLELVRQARARGRDFAAAWAETRDKIVFTTHTPIDAGNEEHEHERLRRVGATGGLTHAQLVELGGDPFNMTVAALRLSRNANAVAELHGETARRMWQHVDDAAPIVAVTNGVDHRVWQDARVAAAIDDGGDEALDEARASLKHELVAEVHKRTGVALDGERMIVGFARRATSYKRATLLFSDEARIAPLLADGRVQVVYSGKAHPRDFGGQELVREMVALGKKYPGSVVFVPNYDLQLGRILTRGVDVWLNTPRRPLEACGTSGMKAAMNGVLNCSILDGWWPEACDHGVNGWAIGERLLENDGDDARDAAALYALVEDEIVPTFYGNRARWRAMMRESIAVGVQQFSSDRMVGDYYTRLYRHAPAIARRKAAANE
ncbi:MAG TPA: alpha-glucan family phosphorylase [Polyangia bacterium]